MGWPLSWSLRKLRRCTRKRWTISKKQPTMGMRKKKFWRWKWAWWCPSNGIWTLQHWTYGSTGTWGNGTSSQQTSMNCSTRIITFSSKRFQRHPTNVRGSVLFTLFSVSKNYSFARLRYPRYLISAISTTDFGCFVHVLGSRVHIGSVRGRLDRLNDSIFTLSPRWYKIIKNEKKKEKNIFNKHFGEFIRITFGFYLIDLLPTIQFGSSFLKL